jgi:ferrous iron transport protein A
MMVGAGNEKSPLPLKNASQGDVVRLVDIRGGARLQHRLAEMGLTPGMEFEIVANNRGGPCVVLVKGTRMMIGRGMIDKIFVVRV